MARYIRRDAFVEAVLFTGENVDEIKAAAVLADAAFKPPSAERAHMGYAIWDSKRAMWTYAVPGKWVVATAGRIRVVGDEAFTAEYAPAEEAVR